MLSLIWMKDTFSKGGDHGIFLKRRQIFRVKFKENCILLTLCFLLYDDKPKSLQGIVYLVYQILFIEIIVEIGIYRIGKVPQSKYFYLMRQFWPAIDFLFSILFCYYGAIY